MGTRGRKGWKVYDTLFCQQAAANRSLSLTQLNLTLYAATFLATRDNAKVIQWHTHRVKQSREWVCLVSWGSSAATVSGSATQQPQMNRKKQKSFTRICRAFNVSFCSGPPECRHCNVCLCWGKAPHRCAEWPDLPPEENETLPTNVPKLKYTERHAVLLIRSLNYALS